MNEQDNNVSFFRFEDLRIYAKAIDYIAWLYDETSNYYNESDAANINVLKDAFLKSAHAIAMNMAEGSSRNKTQFLYYLKMAKSSVRECVVFSEIAYKLKLMTDTSRDYSRNQLMELTKMIGSLIASLQRNTISNNKEEREDDFDDSLL